MKVRKNTAGTVVLTFFGAIFVLLFIGTVAIIEEAENSRHRHAGIDFENTPRSGIDRHSDNVSQAPPMHLPIGNDKEVPFPRDFLIDSLRKGTEIVPERFAPQDRGI